jgi:hypothetical protein
LARAEGDTDSGPDITTPVWPSSPRIPTSPDITWRVRLRLAKFWASTTFHAVGSMSATWTVPLMSSATSDGVRAIELTSAGATRATDRTWPWPPEGGMTSRRAG